MSYECIAPGIYKDSRNGNLYERPSLNGKQTFRRLSSYTLKSAKEEMAARRTDRARSVLGLARDPYAPASKTIAELCDDYSRKGCPDRFHSPRTGKQLADDIARLKLLSKFFGARSADSVRPKDCAAYFHWRKKQMKRTGEETGARTTDMELGCLSNVFNWAASRGIIEFNPIATGRPRFRKSKTIKHCRDFMPADAGELHGLAAHFFRRRQSEVLGWQVLLEAMTGCRTSEVLRLRWDAEDRTEAGFIENEWLWLARSKGGVKPWAHIHPALAETIAALKKWHAWRYPESRWWLPSRWRDEDRPAEQSLTKALARASKKKRTSHGLRAYYVTVRRSQGASDAQIADELGDTSGAGIVVSTYGSVPPNWRGGDGLTWMQKGEPAWMAIKDFPQNLLALGKKYAG